MDQGMRGLKNLVSKLNNALLLTFSIGGFYTVGKSVEKREKDEHNISCRKESEFCGDE